MYIIYLRVQVKTFIFATNPFDKDYIGGVDEADGPSFSGEFTLNLADREGLDELFLEILYGDRIRKTIH